MSGADQRFVDGRQFEKVTVRHWRAVSDAGGIAFDMSSGEVESGVWPDDLKARVEEWCQRYPQYHLEEWEQTYWVSESVWRHLG